MKRSIVMVLLAVALGLVLLAYWQNTHAPEQVADLQDQNSGSSPEVPLGQPTDTTPEPVPPVQDGNFAYDLEQEFTSVAWRLESITLQGKAVNMDVKIEKPLTLQFDRSKKSYGGFGGCNGFGGEYVFSLPYDFDFGLTISTQIYCEGGASDLEQAYFQALDKVNNVGIKGEQLVFTDEKANTTQLVYSRSK